MKDNIVRALEYLHERDLFHMDLKPGNFLIGPGAEWFLCDFGSLVQSKGRIVRQGLTPAYIPRDLKRIAGEIFDCTLLVISAILKVLPGEFSRFDELSMKEIVRIVLTRFRSTQLRDYCLNLLNISQNP
jgi:serine/threonine protein kinase